MKNVFYIILFISQMAWGQKEIKKEKDLDIKYQILTLNRNVFYSNVLKNGMIQSRKEVKKQFINLNAYKALKIYNNSNLVFLAAPIATLAGIGYSSMALIGTNKTALVDGQIVEYKVRPIKKLIVGLGVTAIGVCLFEVANDMKRTSINLYDQKLKAKYKSDIKIDLGLTPNNGLGFYVRL